MFRPDFFVFVETKSLNYNEKICMILKTLPPMQINFFFY